MRLCGSSHLVVLAGLVLIGDTASALAPLASPCRGSFAMQSSCAKINDNDVLETISSRRNFLVTTLATSMAALAADPQIGAARYILDEDTGDYVEIQDKPWQEEWKARLDEASTMSRDEIFNAARGAGNADLKTGPESDASKKRRAMSACRDSAVRAKVGLKDEKECTARVFGGQVDLLLEAL